MMIRCGTAQAEGNQNGGGGILGATMGRAGGYKNAKALYILPCPRKGRCCFTCSMQADRAAGSAGASTAHVWKTKGCTLSDSARPPPPARSLRDSRHVPPAAHAALSEPPTPLRCFMLPMTTRHSARRHYTSHTASRPGPRRMRLGLQLPSSATPCDHSATRCSMFGTQK